MRFYTVVEVWRRESNASMWYDYFTGKLLKKIFFIYYLCGKFFNETNGP